MNTRLRPLSIVDFTGGLNTRRTQFTLGPNESPDMLNVEVDQRAGFYTRRGWERWNVDDVMPVAEWNPRLAKQHLLSTGTFRVYVANKGSTYGTVYAGNASGVFDDLFVYGNAHPHMVDFAVWGDIMYMATGRNAADIPSGPTRDNGSAITELNDAATAWNDDYTVPVGGTMPFADLCESHAGYLFVAGTKEGGVQHPNRVRWSHPNNPEDWAELDYLDINKGGSHITAILSFRDHLLIFKTDSVWALYGYDLDSWQLAQVSDSIGTPQTGSATRSINAVFFFSASDRGGVYAYSGQAPVHLTEKLRTDLESITAIEDVWCEWTGKRLWVSTPDAALVFDPEVGEGAWVRHRPARGTMGPIVKRSDADSEYPLACLNADSGAAVLVRLDYRDDCFDAILEDYSPYLTDLNTGNRITDLNTGNFLTDGSVAPVPGDAFEAYYRTGWIDAGEPTRKKSWRRPKFLMAVPPQTVGVRADVYWDYDETNARRSRTGFFTPEGAKQWTSQGAADPSGQGFDWGDGTLWGAGTKGASMERITTGLGVNEAIQIEVRSDPSTLGRPWSFEGMFLPHVLRRYTT